MFVFFQYFSVSKRSLQTSPAVPTYEQVQIDTAIVQNRFLLSGEINK